MSFVYSQRSLTLLLSALLHILLLLYVFFDIHIKRESQQIPEKKDWATRNPGASQFGAPVIFYTPPQTQNKQSAKQEKKGKKKNIERENAPTEQIKQHQVKSIAIKQQTTSEKQKSIQKTQQKQQKAKTVNKNSPLSLATLLNGFLQQRGTGQDVGLRHKGDAKKPPDEQIKYERFAQKIHWCIQNAFRINRHKLVLPHAVRSVMSLHLEFKDNGMIHDVKLLKPSGSVQLDQFMIDLVKDAGRSFPPIPKFLDKRLLPKLYNIAVDIPSATTGSQLSMSL